MPLAPAASAGPLTAHLRAGLHVHPMAQGRKFRRVRCMELEGHAHLARLPGRLLRGSLERAARAGEAGSGVCEASGSLVQRVTPEVVRPELVVLPGSGAAAIKPGGLTFVRREGLGR